MGVRYVVAMALLVSTAEPDREDPGVSTGDGDTGGTG